MRGFGGAGFGVRLRPRLAVLAVSGGALLACIGGPPIPAEGEIDGLRTLSASTPSDGDGFATFTFDVVDETSALLTFYADDPHLVYVDAVYGPDGSLVLDGAEWANSPYSLTGGVYLDGVASVGWPVLEADALSPGTWTVEVGVTDAEAYYVSGVNTSFEAQLKSDLDPTGGELAVDVVYVGDVGEDADTVAAMEDAVAVWQDIYADIGISVIPEFYVIDGPAVLDPPGMGSAADYQNIAEQTDFRAVNVVIAEDLGQGGLYGMAGGIPGPLVATGVSGVGVSVLTNAGPDLVFNSLEVRILGETLAHEVGHFLGLHHPVEQSVDAWDALSDTPECDNLDSCESLLGDNLMFPYPVCSQSDCVPQGALTGGQAFTSNAYAAVE